MVDVRRATRDDSPLLEQMLAIDADWRPDGRVRPMRDVMRQPELAHYVSGWPRIGDVGFIAEVERPIGAAWWRYFTEADPGFGFVDTMTPEVSVGVVGHARGRGVSTSLLDALITEGRDLAVPALSLSVEVANPALRLYQRLGFVPAGSGGGALTMVMKLVE